MPSLPPPEGRLDLHPEGRLDLHPEGRSCRGCGRHDGLHDSACSYVDEWVLRDPSGIAASANEGDLEAWLTSTAWSRINAEEKQDPERRRDQWAALLSMVRVGGALPVTFQLDGDHVWVELIVPYVTSDPPRDVDPNRIPLAIAEGFPVPLRGRHALPTFTTYADATKFLREIVREIYHHEIDEQFRVGATRPFAPDHDA